MIQPSPITRDTFLADGRMCAPVPATVVRGFPAARLAAVEASWRVPRAMLAVAVRDAGGHLEHWHWDWRGKPRRVESGELSLVGVESDGDVQGLMAVAERPRASVLPGPGIVLYIDYLESAPWNNRAPGHPPKLVGVGTVLVAEAVRMSVERQWGGRVALHSLPQAERFYERNCRMRRVGPDVPPYPDLTYFEYPDGEGPAWLESVTARSDG